MEHKFIISGVPICRARRDGESDRIPSADDLAAIVKNFDPKTLQVPICPHEGAEKDFEAQGWVLKLATKKTGNDLFLVMEEGVLVDSYLAYCLRDGRRGPRSIRWHTNPYNRGAQILHLAFLGSENPGVDSLPALTPEQIQPVEPPPEPDSVMEYDHKFAYSLSAEIAARSLVSVPFNGTDLNAFLGIVPSKRQEDFMEINEKELNELKEQAAEAAALKLRIEESNKEIKAEREKSFNLNLSAALSAVPEGARERIESAARKMAEGAGFDAALEFAKDLAKDAAPPTEGKNLEGRLPGPGGSASDASKGDPLFAHNLKLAESFLAKNA